MSKIGKEKGENVLASLREKKGKEEEEEASFPILYLRRGKGGFMLGKKRERNTTRFFFRLRGGEKGGEKAQNPSPVFFAAKRRESVKGKEEYRSLQIHSRALGRGKEGRRREKD